MGIAARIEKDEQSRKRLEAAYHSEKPRFMARLRSSGKNLEDAEDIVHDLYVETMERLSLLNSVHNLPAWLNSLFGRRLIDVWRRERTRAAAEEIDVAEETLREIITSTGLDPLDTFVRENMVDALNDALRALPKEQREVVEAQVFGGLTFKEIAEKTGESIDTLTARKRYALRKLSFALRHWIED
ncbi:MAG: sigma-70 family RNA polymerase sigma factor [Treponemataceae bacterium]